MEAKDCDPMTGKDCGPMARAGMHGPNPLVEGKQLAFEAQRLHEHMEHALEGGDKGSAGGVVERARQGLAALRRKLSDGYEGIVGRGSNNPPPAVGEVGYGDPASELNQNMKASMEEAAEAIRHTKTVIMEQDPPHVHAPELFHPEAVMSMAEVRAQSQAASSNVSVKETVAAAVNNLAEDAREGIDSMVSKMVGGGEGTLQEQEQEEEFSMNEALEAMFTYGPE